MSDPQSPSGGSAPRQNITLLLEAVTRTSGEGRAASGAMPSGQAASELLGLVYDQLRKIAQQRMNGERRDHTLQATALVHEAYARLVGDAEVQWANRAHFFAAAAEAMRRILIEHARGRNRLKRGGDGGSERPDENAAAPNAARKRIPLDVVDLAEADDPEQIMAVDECICRLEAEDPTAGAVVRLRFFAGLDVAQTAAALGISERTVAREWSYARAVLAKELGTE